MSKVRFNLRPNANKDAHIQLIYRIKGDDKKLVIGTKLNVPEKYWNKKTMRVRETKEFLDYIPYNAILNKWEDAVNQAMKDFHLAGKVPSKSELNKKVVAIMKGGGTESNNVNFLVYFDEFIKRREKTAIRPSTIQLYKNAKKHLEAYQKNKLRNRTLEFQDLNRDFFINFINHLGADLERNTINKIVKQIRTVINDAKANGVNVNMDYKLSHTQVAFTSQPKIYLNQNEIDDIIKVELKPFSRLDKVRDLFLIGVYTGLRFSDFSRVTGNHVSSSSKGKKVIRIKTKKTQTFVTVPLKEIVVKIFDKYEGQLPRISEQKFNQYLKELCKLAAINQSVSKLEKGEQVFYEKWELVSSHICRRSFATNSFKAGIHPKYIMPITGHKTIKQYMSYISIDEEESVELVSENPFFN